MTIQDFRRIVKKATSKEQIKHIFQHNRSSWLGVAVILILTIVFFWPIMTRLGSYSPGGDSSFNAWTLARDQHCILRENCTNYANGNIFYPHKDTMLYSEDQLSAGVLTLPLFWINQNPIFSYNVWTIVSFFLSGLFMFLLVRYLSRGNRESLVISILAGLVFEFAPLKIAAIDHLQNLSIFYLPLAFLLVFKYLDTKRRLYLFALFVVLTLQFYASWYQMAFVLLAIVILLLGLLAFKLANWKKITFLFISVFFAVLATLPLATQYLNFSKSTQASFNALNQSVYSSSLADYFIPNNGTILGKIYYTIRPHSQVNAYNPDSYSYHGFTMYILAILIITMSFVLWRKSKKEELRKMHKLVLIFTLIAVVAFVVSLGPLLKLKGSYFYPSKSLGLNLIIPLPYILVDKFLPQLSFIRAIGRASVLTLFSLCCLLAYIPIYLKDTKLHKRTVGIIIGVIVVLVSLDVLPAHRVYMSSDPTDYNLSIPAAYKFIKNDKAIKNYIVLASDDKRDYANVPYERAIQSELIWAGYTNKNMFNGTSGYIPPNYYPQYISFLTFTPSTINQLLAMNIHYLVVDKQLSQTGTLVQNTSYLLHSNLIYSDQRYNIYKL
jgi:hypothetical protein